MFLDKDTLAYLRNVRRMLGISFVIVSDEVVEGSDIFVGSVTIEREDPESPVVEMFFTEHYNAICGEPDPAGGDELPCDLRLGHKGEHKYGSGFRLGKPYVSSPRAQIHSGD